MNKKHVKKRIRNKHQHHEEHLKESIREEVLEEFVEQEQRLLAREQKLLDRIDYLVGANNEAFDLLRKCEEEHQYDEIKFNRKTDREETASEALISDPF
jgi:hypothetical protein